MGVIQEFYASLSASQEPIGDGFESVVYAALWARDDTDDEPITYWGA